MSKPKLLLADDSITIQKVVNLTFADQGMDVFAFSDGDAAVENFDSIKPDIVLADVNMPGINGYQLCELLKSDSESSRIPVLLLVGTFEPFDRDEAERVGASGHLTKPFTSIADLVAMVNQLLTGPAEPEPQQVEELSVPVAPVPGADTSDIDHLYEQSFVETVEIPQNQERNVGYHNDLLDDEMIQTSYAEADLGMPDQESYYVESDLDEMDAVDVVSAEPEESSPVAEEPEEPSPVAEEPQEISPAAEITQRLREGPESAADEADYLGADFDSDDEAAHLERSHNQEPAEIKRADPFASLAAEPPPVHFVETFVPASPGAAMTDPDDFDLLELPVSGRGRPVESTAPAAGQETASLSPELIDLIVEKVLERLAERSASGEAQSATRP